MERHGIIVKPGKGLGAAFNPAAIALPDGRIILMPRVVPEGYKKVESNAHDENYHSMLGLWIGESPTSFRCIEERVIVPDSSFDGWACEDPRITKIKDTYYILYTALPDLVGRRTSSDGDIRIAMASTKGFKTFKKHGVIGPDRQSKAGVLFESAGKLYFMWKDSENAQRTLISPAIEDYENAAAWQEFWKNRDIEKDVVLSPQDNTHEGCGVEPGAPPIEIEEGLLVVYSSISEDKKWSISVVLLDKNDPSKIISQTETPVLTPEEDYEVKGDIENVVFPCGALIKDGRLYVYYGGADTVCAVASEDMTEIKKLLRPFEENPVNPKPAPS